MNDEYKDECRQSKRPSRAVPFFAAVVSIIAIALTVMYVRSDEELDSFLSTSVTDVPGSYTQGVIYDSDDQVYNGNSYSIGEDDNVVISENVSRQGITIGIGSDEYVRLSSNGVATTMVAVQATKAVPATTAVRATSIVYKEGSTVYVTVPGKTEYVTVPGKTVYVTVPGSTVYVEKVVTKEVPIYVEKEVTKIVTQYVYETTIPDKDSSEAKTTRVADKATNNEGNITLGQYKYSDSDEAKLISATCLRCGTVYEFYCFKGYWGSVQCPQCKEHAKTQWAWYDNGQLIVQQVTPTHSGWASDPALPRYWY